MGLPKSVEDFRGLVGTSQSALALLGSLGTKMPGSCIRCGSSKTYLLRKRSLVRCRDCGLESSMTSGTPLHGTHLSLSQWLLALFLASRVPGPVTPKILVNEGVVDRYSTAWMIVRQIHAIMKGSENGLLSGRVSATIARTMLGRTSPDGYIEGQDEGVVLAGATTRWLSETQDEDKPKVTEVKRLRMAVVPSRGPMQMRGFLQHVVEAGSTVMLPKRLEPAAHDGCRYLTSAKQADELPALFLMDIREEIVEAIEWIEAAKPKINLKRLDEYLDEYVFHFNNGFDQNAAFPKLVAAAFKQKPSTE